MIYFTADTHFGHANILTYTKRPYTTVEEMDEGLIHNWNACITPEDTVYLVGDFSFHKPDKTNWIFDRLNGTKHLVLGNHDRMLKPATLAKFASVNQMLTVKVPDTTAHDGKTQRIELCHYAMRVWDKSHYGAYSCHGHSHGSLPDDPNALSLDVGVDNHNCYPVSYDQVKAIMAKKTYKSIDHHGRHRNG